MAEKFQSDYISYTKAGFSKIVVDYIAQSDNLKSFNEHELNIEGIKNAIQQRKIYNTNRTLLVDQLQIQYQNLNDCDAVKANIHQLLQANTFTICTAHQPNIFTGHLYFIYKIFHAIKLADELKKQLPEYNFIPVYFMGSEDADLEELNHIIIDGKKFTWNTKQKGAVGRMKADDALLKIIDEISGRLSVEKYGNEITYLLKKCYKKDATIEQATFLFVHELFKSYGLLIFLPDNGSLKRPMNTIFHEDIFKNTSSEIVHATSKKLSEHYKVQAQPREINLFYLKDNIRNRIIKVDEKFAVNDTAIVFTKEELHKELSGHPERFSPNVILRGLYQEMVLPNIAFIGGGGELAYWLELKDLFHHYKVPYPLVILRNSFLLIEKNLNALIEKLHISNQDLFKNQMDVFNEIVKKLTTLRLHIDSEKLEIKKQYDSIKEAAGNIDLTLKQHVEALQVSALKRLDILEKKMLRAEKRKFADIKNQVEKIYKILFPENNLQERTENFMLFYAKWGSEFFETLYENSLTTQQEFCVMKEVE